MASVVNKFVCRHNSDVNSNRSSIDFIMNLEKPIQEVQIPIQVIARTVRGALIVMKTNPSLPITRSFSSKSEQKPAVRMKGACSHHKKRHQRCPLDCKYRVKKIR
jgi:hypothetical protein